MRAVITDLDRTLLHTDKTISEYTLRILAECRRRGMVVMAASARPERTMMVYQQQAGFDACVSLNGAKVHLPGGMVEYDMARASAESILRKACGEPEVYISVETDAGIFSNRDDPFWNPTLFEHFPALPPCRHLYKLLLSSPAEGFLEKARTFLTPDTYASVAIGTYLQVMDRRATKWHGVQAMLDAFSISPADAVYFGDDEDDAEPVRRCGRGVAMANAIDAVLRAADEVTQTNDEDGVARWIERNLL